MPTSLASSLTQKRIVEELQKLEIERGKKGKYKDAKRELEIELEARDDAFEKGLEAHNITLKKLKDFAKEHYDIGTVEISMLTDQLSDGLSNLFWLNEQKERAFLKFFKAICEKGEKKSGE